MPSPILPLWETVSRIIRCVLDAILKLHTMMLEKPSPVLENCMDHRWKYFKVCAGYLFICFVSLRRGV
ncbi:hypothetical protein LINPERHAP2_LOCUS17007 [Linum perenne]